MKRPRWLRPRLLLTYHDHNLIILPCCYRTRWPFLIEYNRTNYSGWLRSRWYIRIRILGVGFNLYWDLAWS